MGNRQQMFRYWQWTSQSSRHTSPLQDETVPFSPIQSSQFSKLHYQIFFDCIAPGESTSPVVLWLLSPWILDTEWQVFRPWLSVRPFRPRYLTRTQRYTVLLGHWHCRSLLEKPNADCHCVIMDRMKFGGTLRALQGHMAAVGEVH